MVNLDDTNESVFYIPFEGSDEEQNNQPEEIEYDVLDGSAMRWDAYKATWTKCLNRVQNLVHALYEPAVAQVVERVQLAYESDGVLPALPHPELPAIAVTNPSSDTAFLSSVISDLCNGDQDHPHLVTHLYPSACPNLTSAMASIISGFISSGSYKTSARSLASYDINVLKAWYIAQDTKPRLVLLLHDFEQFDPGVVQDLIYICSLHISQVPLVLLISLSSPQSPSYLHVAYPRATLKLLRLHRIVAPTQYATRFNPSVDAILSILQLAHLKHFLSNPLAALVQTTPSTKALRNPSSSAFLKLLSATLSFNDTNSEGSSDGDEAFWNTKILSDAIKRVNNARTEFRDRAREMRLGFLLLQLVHDFLLQRGYKGLGLHWGAHPSTAPVGAVAVGLSFGERQSSTSNSSSPTYLQNFINLLQREQSQALKDFRYARTLLRKLKPEELRSFLEILVGYFKGLPEKIAEELDMTDTISKLEGWQMEAEEAFEGSDAESETGEVEMKNLTEKLAEWMFDYLSEITAPLEDSTLWDVWYTGMAPFPSEVCVPSLLAQRLINSTYRLSILQFVHPSSLVSYVPETLFRRHVEDNVTHISDDEEEDVSLWRLPDTSILFHRYLDSGKIINVYDWFESFHGVLGTQRREKAKNEAKAAMKAKEKRGRRKSASPRKNGASKSKSPVKHNGKGKSKAKEVPDDEEEVEAEAGGDDEEAWKIVVQARFIRALHELDFMGFVKHTRRKPDHVLRTVFEAPD
ncbi:hypothetical protein BT96DRAFT_996138 [Gymnopus androsaceus JB14]|uniref:Uncharacterized protein n=1 Tax=Gymnopus androsaceus JB14 TaxID=1447944 RepID=A0A6A4HGJ4_9AGAR|nr:hypothetical protein BT96DRAFT_996138 [Gymnopus androsaceus JB14]